MPPIPKLMHGILISKLGSPEVLEYRTDLPIPVPKDDEILVENEFAGVNYIDTYFRDGTYKTSLPTILGREAAGKIVTLGSSNPYNFRIGDRVVYMHDSNATYSEYMATPSLRVFKIPDGVESSTAAASLLQGLTALTLIREAHPVKEGEWALVHAAAGGVGLWLCQLLRAVGARVIGTASTLEKLEIARSTGAEWVVGPKEDIGDRVKSITGDEGVHVVFDGVGKSTFDISMGCLRRKGSMVSFGNASGVAEPVALLRLGQKNIKLTRPVVNNYVSTREEFVHYCTELFKFIVDDGIQVKIHKIYPLKDAAQAHTDLESRKTMGKLLLRCE